MKEAEIVNLFTFHPPPTTSHGVAHNMVRNVLGEAARVLSHLTPECAEQTIAIRKLQEAMFYANAAIALNPQKLPNFVALKNPDRPTAFLQDDPV